MTQHARSQIAASVGLAVATLVVFWPILGCDFVNLDDPENVTENSHVLGGLTREGVAWAFRTGHTGNWYPLTWLSYMLDVELFGRNAGGLHLTNLLLHVANTVLLFLALKRLTAAHWPSAFVAALFALHPLHVEPVAWISDRKDVLSAFFGLLALWAYGRYAFQRASQGAVGASRVMSPSSSFYWLAVLFFACGLMSKATLVTLPFVMLLLDYWPLHRFELSRFDLQFPTLARLLREKMPFFVLGAIFCVVAFSLQRKAGAVHSLSDVPIPVRLENALVSYALYLAKAICPAGLAIPYSHEGHWPAEQVVFAAVLVVGLCLGTLWLGRKFPFVVTGWFWFFGMTVPVNGLVQVGIQFMADRYQYMPLIGVFMLWAWGAGEALKRWQPPKAAVGIVAGLILAACAIRTRDQLGYWQNSETLFLHALAVTKDNATANYNLGMALVQNGRMDEAIAYLKKATEIHSNNPRVQVMAQNNLGNAVLLEGRMDEAIAHFQKALEIQPDFAQAHYNLGNALFQKGTKDQAAIHYWRAVEIQPGFAPAHNNLGTVLLEQGRVDEAIAHFQKALDSQPDFADARNNLAWVLATSPLASVRNGAKALQLAQQAERLSGGTDPMILETLAAANAETGRFVDAVTIARRALQLAAAQNDTALVNALQEQLRFYQAGAPFRETHRTNP
jgi:protein O-mannosyl-transferase